MKTYLPPVKIANLKTTTAELDRRVVFKSGEIAKSLALYGFAVVRVKDIESCTIEVEEDIANVGLIYGIAPKPQTRPTPTRELHLTPDEFDHLMEISRNPTQGPQVSWREGLLGIGISPLPSHVPASSVKVKVYRDAEKIHKSLRWRS